MSFQFIKTNNHNSHHVKIITNGPSGSGKTVMCATTGAPNKTLIVSAEGGLLSLRGVELNAVEVRTLEQVEAVLEWLETSENAKGIEWVCVDSISEIAEVVLSHEKGQTTNALRAYGEMQDKMSKLIRRFRDLPCNIYMSCKEERIHLSDGSMLYGPSMPSKKLTENMPYFFDECFALRVITNEDGNVERWLQTNNNGTHLAKDRSGTLDLFEKVEGPTLQRIRNKILNIGEES